MADVGVVEGAAGAKERAEEARAVILDGDANRANSPVWLRGLADSLACDVLALVADREALLERIKDLESGSGTAACSGGDHHWIDEPQIVCAHCGSFQ